MTCTVVSIFPLAISEFKPGQIPDTYFVEKGSVENPSLLRVNRGLDHRFVGGEFGSINVPVEPEEIAESIVKDFCDSVILSEEGAKPGIFWLKGDVSVEDAKKTPEFTQARVKQIAWFVKIVQLADDNWGQYKRHSMIMEIQRIAARELGLEKEWLQGVDELRNFKCPACATQVDKNAIVCASCKVVLKPEEYKKLQFAGAAAQ